MSDTIPQNLSQKQCPKCHRWQLLTRFPINKKAKNGVASWCKDCANRRARETLTPEIIRDRMLRCKYGITLQQYYRMLEAQNGLCASCHKPETRIDHSTKRVKLLRVDHDHKTGDVRMLLCDRCNLILGLVEEDPEHLRGIADYAEWCNSRKPNEKVVQSKLFDIIPDLPVLPEEDAE